MNRFLYINYKNVYKFFAVIRIAYYDLTKHNDKCFAIIAETDLFVPILYKWIEITWLPDIVNDPAKRRCYIGHRGIVTEVYSDGTFELNINGNGTILLVDREYKFDYINSPLTTISNE